MDHLRTTLTDAERKLYKATRRLINQKVLDIEKAIHTGASDEELKAMRDEMESLKTMRLKPQVQDDPANKKPNIKRYVLDVDNYLYLRMVERFSESDIADQLGISLSLLRISKKRVGMCLTADYNRCYAVYLRHDEDMTLEDVKASFTIIYAHTQAGARSKATDMAKYKGVPYTHIIGMRLDMFDGIDETKSGNLKKMYDLLYSYINLG